MESQSRLRDRLRRPEPQASLQSDIRYGATLNFISSPRETPTLLAQVI
jgi:hypothetical protein